MPTVSLNKTIEATKLNKRTGFAESGPEINIPFGALVEHLGADRDYERFNYLGEPYRCKHDLWASAAGAPAQPATPAAQAVVTDVPKLVWETLPSTHHSISRSKVAGGWLVVAGGSGITFYPDPAHEWDGTSLAS